MANAFQIRGRIVRARTGLGIARLRVEAWLAAEDARRPLATASTTKTGRFRLSFDSPPRRKTLDLYLKVFKIESTQGGTADRLLFSSDSSPMRKVKPQAIDWPDLHIDDSRLFNRTNPSALKKQAAFDAKRWRAAMELKRNMPRLTLRTEDPGPEAWKKLKPNQVGAFLRRGNHQASVTPARNPRKNASFGFAGVFVRLNSERSFVDGTLIVRFDPEKLGPVDRESLRLFRWDKPTQRFHLVSDSSVGAEGDYVWARVSRPGRYAVIGVNAFPPVYQTVKLLCTVSGMGRAVSLEAGSRLIERICLVILCSPELMQDLARPEIFETLVRMGDREGFLLPEGQTEPLPPGLNPGDPCQHCTGLSGAWLPECEIIRHPPPGSSCADRGWEPVGPFNLSGCIRQVAVDPTDSNRLYCAAANGGVWVLNGVDRYPYRRWRSLTDQLETLQMEAVAVAPGDNAVLYAASWSGHLYRSGDSGISWARTSSAFHGAIRRILVHPADSDTVLVASSHGLRISSDGGSSWEPRLYTGDLSDAAIDPQNSSIIYIAQRGVGIHKTFTMGFGAGAWQTIFPWDQANAPTNTFSRIALGYRNSDGTLQDDSDRTVVAKLGEEIWINQRGGRDGPADWVFKGARGNSGSDPTRHQLGWNNCLAVDPFDPDVILAGGRVLDRTDDGGDSWTQVASFYRPHEDQQSLAFDRNNSGLVYLSNDGGVYRSTDRGVTWYVEGNSVGAEISAGRSLVRDLATAEFYRVGVQGHRAVGNLYHSGIIAAGALSSGLWSGIEGHAWEFNYVFSDPKRRGRFYVFGSELLRRRYPGTGSDDFIAYGQFKPFTLTNAAVGAIAVDTRSASNTILAGAENDAATDLPYRLMITTEGDREPRREPDDTISNLPTWTAVLEDDEDPFVSIRFAPSAPGKAYVISRNGKVFRKHDVNAPGGWEQPGRWGTSARVRQLAVNFTHDDRLYAVTRYRVGRSIDGGGSWSEVGAATLPDTELNSIAADPRLSTVIYVGADSGVYFSNDEGDSWSPFDDDLPNAEILQIYFEDDYLYAVTYGRGLWRRRLC